MKLVLLGTGGYHPNESRHTACLMLPELGLVLDAGTAMFRLREHLCTRRLDILLSHAHLDHIVGLTYLLDVLEGRQVNEVNVYGTAETLTALESHLFAEAIFPVRPTFKLRPLGSALQIGCADVRCFPLAHPGGSTGFRIDLPGRSLAYITDTTAQENAPYLEHIQGVDVLVHECYFPDRMSELAAVTGHSCLSPVARLARSAGVRRLVLVHMDPRANAGSPLDLSAARTIFPSTEIGTDMMEISV